jgi:hypothetical protein
MFRIGNAIDGGEGSRETRRFLLSAAVLGAFAFAVMLPAELAEAQQANVDLATDERVVEAIGEQDDTITLTGASVSGNCDVNGDG